jgi:hypothetical protein
MTENIRSDTTDAQQRFKYVEHVRTNDTLCLNAVKKAQNDLIDSLYFVIWSGPFGRPLRYEDELKFVSRKHGLKFDYEFGGCLVFENQTEGCYKDYMDKRLFEKFGENFKEKLHLKADSLFLVNHLNDTICSWDCDKEPSFKNKRIGPDGILITLNSRNKLTRNANKLLDVYNPFIDIQFVINKQGKVSEFKLVEDFPPRPKNQNNEILLKIAANEIETSYSKWIPGEIHGVKLITTYVLRVHFKKGTQRR